MMQYAVLLSLALSLYAQPLSLKEALRRAIQQHPALRAAQYIVPLARADSLGASLFPNPQLNLEYTQTPSALRQLRLTAPEFGQWQFNFTQNIDVAGQRRRRVRYAEEALGVAAETYRSTLHGILAEVAQRWIELWSAERSVAILSRAVASADSLVAVNRMRLGAQAISPADVWRAEILAAQYRLQLLQMQQTARSAQRWLQYALATTDSITTQQDDTTVTVAQMSLNEWIDRALHARAEYRLAESLVRTADANVALQDALGVSNPDIGLASVQQDGIFYIGFQVNYPLPLLNRNQGERQKARIALDQARTEQERLYRQIVTEVRIAYENYAIAQQALAQARTVLAKASDVLQTVQMAYLKGATPIIDLLDAQRSWYETQRSYYEALADSWRATLGLLVASGEWSYLLGE